MSKPTQYPEDIVLIHCPSPEIYEQALILWCKLNGIPTTGTDYFYRWKFLRENTCFRVLGGSLESVVEGIRQGNTIISAEEYLKDCQKEEEDVKPMYTWVARVPTSYEEAEKQARIDAGLGYKDVHIVKAVAKVVVEKTIKIIES